VGAQRSPPRRRDARPCAREREVPEDLDSCLLDEIEAFFAHYNKLEGKGFRVLDRCGPKSAVKLLEAARRKSENK